MLRREDTKGKGGRKDTTAEPNFLGGCRLLSNRERYGIFTICKSGWPIRRESVELVTKDLRAAVVKSCLDRSNRSVVVVGIRTAWLLLFERW